MGDNESGTTPGDPGLTAAVSPAVGVLVSRRESSWSSWWARSQCVSYTAGSGAPCRVSPVAELHLAWAAALDRAHLWPGATRSSRPSFLERAGVNQDWDGPCASATAHNLPLPGRWCLSCRPWRRTQT